jgi:uncharacterized protein YjbJ (UPF0337 family)
MTTTPSKTEAKKDQFVGDVKETAGSAVGNESLESKGKTQHGTGLVEETAANVSGFVTGTVNQVTGATQGIVNSIFGNNSGEASAKATEKKGEAQKEVNS